MKKYVFALLIWFLSFGLLSAEQLVPKDFAFGIPLTVNEPATLYSLSVPKQVYQNIDRKDFGDIRIFNSDNIPVPHALKTKVSTSVSKLAPQTLAFFPVIKSKTGDKNAFSLNINTDTRGAIINVRTEKPENTDDLLYYLIDLSALKITPEKLLFKWQGSQENFNIKTTLEHSQNLTDWTTIRTDTTLAKLNFSGNVLIKDKINLQSINARYLRLGWPIPLTEAKITQIQAIFPEEKKSFPLEWESFPPESITAKNNTVEYQIKGVFPASSIRLDLPEENTIFKAQLRSRPDKNAEWKLQYSGLFYNININGTALTSDPVILSKSPDRFWQLEFLSEAPDLTKSVPKLKIGWISHNLYFLNQGKPPFTLAFGNYEINPAQNLVDQLFSNMDDEKKQSMVKVAVPGKLFLLGEKKMQPAAIPWQKWTLWAVLISGVCLLAVMALKLFKQINSKT